MFIASPWMLLLIGACLVALIALAAMSWALAPFLRAIYHSGSVLQKGAAAGLVLLLGAEAGMFAWMALAL
jgi:hypothetical protein